MILANPALVSLNDFPIRTFYTRARGGIRSNDRSYVLWRSHYFIIIIIIAQRVAYRDVSGYGGGGAAYVVTIAVVFVALLGLSDNSTTGH